MCEGRIKKMEEGQRRDEAAETQTGLGVCERKIKYSHHKNNDRTLNYSKECVASCCVCLCLNVACSFKVRL